MYHSVNFEYPGQWQANTYEDFHLVPDGRPVVAMPNPVTSFIEVPGASGLLDMSEGLTGYPQYGNREGSLSFIVLNDYGENNTWVQRYQTICTYLHNRQAKMSLEDDPLYFYLGRFTVDEWSTPNSNDHSKVTIGYSLDPYKYWQNETTKTETLSGSGSKTLSYSRSAGNLGSMPAVPKFEVSSITNKIQIQILNPERSSSPIIHEVTSSGTYKFNDAYICDAFGTNQCEIRLSGTGTITIRLRNGDL